jgi:hypothetical protein
VRTDVQATVFEVDASTSAVRAIAEMPKEDNAVSEKQEFTT